MTVPCADGHDFEIFHSFNLDQEAFPAPGSGPLKRQRVIKEARKGLDLGSKDPSAAFGRWFGAAMLKIAIEVAVAVMNQIKKAATDG